MDMFDRKQAVMQFLNFKVRTYFLKGELKIKTNPLIFLCQVIIVWDEIQIEIVANGLRQSAVDCKGYRGDWVCVWLLEAEG